ncbi:3-methyladenine DNA glycosylase AlkD [Parelusimicrobium proximum]|uniref:DNA alkylation repair protein n=1 Tax=Parelusimicrobium proximum TaxID=3228953 RepID=UPI003D16A401
MDIIKELRKELKQNTDEKTLNSQQHFFKESILLYGVKIPLVNKIAAACYAKYLKTMPKADVFKLCETLWQSGYIEESFIACNWAYARRDEFVKDDIKTFELWLGKYVNNWASCDTLCNHTVADVVEKYPSLISYMKKWTNSANRWVRRGAAVTLIIPARKGMFLQEIFEISDSLIKDSDDLVQKGYGWALKAASEAHAKEVFDYLLERKDIMPRTAYRYALEKMPAELRKKAMAK